MPSVVVPESDVELARRLRARKRLEQFILYMDERFLAEMPPHVPTICKQLEDVVKYIETGQGTPILVVAIPPGHLKTTIVSDYLTAWFHGRNPDMRVINTSYSGTLAEDSSARVRDMIQGDPNYANVFGKKATFHINDKGDKVPEVNVETDTRAKGKWRIVGNMGEHFAVGFGGTVTGRRAHLIIVDDPYASRAEAESQATQKAVITFFRSTLYSRRQKNCAIVIIMQLWNNKDLVGWLKRVTDPEDPEYIEEFPPVHYLMLPALAMKNDPLGRDEGKALWPNFQDEVELKGTKAVLGDYYFSSQYQQTPTEPEGNIFKRYWFPVMQKTQSLYKIQYWDTAEKDKQENDYWCGVTMSVTTHGLLLEDLVYKKMETAEGIETIYSFYDQHNTEQEPVSVVWIEDKSSGGPIISVMRAGERTIPVDAVRPVGDKVSRANAVTHVCKNRRVHLLQHSKWISTFLEEMTAFPRGDHDDLPDGVVGAISKLVHGGHIRTSDIARQTHKQEQKRDVRDGAATYEERHAEVFGRDGKGLQQKNRGARLRQAPSLPS